MGKSISATVIADSVSRYGDRLTTLEVTFPRFLLAELNTHRVFSRNSASSRARSVKKTIQEVADDPFVPWHWPTEQVGMAGGREFTDPIAVENLARHWVFASEQAVERARELADAQVHKSIVNRLLEPFMWHTAVITATEWGNFFTQRLALLEDGRPAAEPHFYDLARAMRTAMDESTPDPVNEPEWHLPYIAQRDHHYIGDLPGNPWVNLIKISVARCAGVSYLNQDQQRPYEKDLALYDRLATADPPHWSPFEHVARPAETWSVFGGEKFVTPRRYNLTGWASLRWYVEAGGATLNDDNVI